MLAGLIGALAVGIITQAGLGSPAVTTPREGARAIGIATPHARTRRSRRRTPGAPPGVTVGRAAVPAAAAARLDAVLAKALSAAGPRSGAVVYDLGTRHLVFARRATILLPPASVEKLYTTVALLRLLGPRTRLHTTVLGSGRLEHGAWRGSLYLRGGGDPTFGDSGFNRIWEHGYGATVTQLVAQLVARGIRRVTGPVYADESLFDRRRGGLLTGYAPDTPDFGGQLSALTYDHGSALKRLGPARFADQEFVLTLRGSGIRARAARHTAITPPGARLLANTNSPPLSVMLRLMDVPSDDLYAETFTKQLGVLFGGGGTIADGAKVIQGTIAADFGLQPTILDGSGLSRQDRSSPAQVVALLREVWHTPLGGELAAALPTVGIEGTVSYLGRGTAARGRCIAKTGTLDFVTNLAGYCHTKPGHDLAFALFLDGPPNYVASLLESKMIGAIARYP